jgi:hypothetical protein
MPWLLSLALFAAVLAVSYGAAIGFLVAPQDRPSWAEAIVACVLGLASLAFLLLVLRWLSWPAPLAAVPLIAAASWQAYRRRGRLLPRLGRQDGAGVAALVAAVFLLPLFAGLFLMAFVNADTPFRLTHAYQFVEDRGMPPASLSNLGVRWGYHYNSPAAVAATVVLTGLPVHSAFFLTIFAVAVGTVAVSALLAEALHGRLPFALVFALILVAVPITAWHMGKAPVAWLDDPQLFFNHFPDLTVSYGIFLFLLTLHACLNLTSRRNLALALLATVVLAAAKFSYFVVAGLLVFSAALVRTYRTRDLRCLLLPAVCFVAGLAVNQVAGISGSVGMAVEPLFLFAENSKRGFKHGLDLLLFVVPAVLYWWIAGRSSKATHEQRDRLAILGLTLVGLLAFLNLVGSYVTSPDGTREPNVNFLEPLKMLPKLLAATGVLALAALWSPDRRKLNRGIVLFLSLIVAVPLAHRVTHTVILLVRPEAAHEYVDNRAIGEALAQIPVAGSIVTNDLRYPADDYKRDHRQMQIPALFGHQAYAANTRYERDPTAERRIAQQARLARKAWDPELPRIAAEESWTHLLIHKGAPYPEEIPLTAQFENDRYIVYTFD